MPLTNLNISVADKICSKAVTEVTVAMNYADNVLILAANSNRIGATIYNNSPAPVFIDFAPIDSAAILFAVKLAADAYYEVPFGYVGAIYGASSPGNAGNVYVREFI